MAADIDGRLEASDLEAVIVQPNLPMRDRLWHVAVHEAGHVLVGQWLSRGAPLRVCATSGAANVDLVHAPAAPDAR